jgi:hypothetical protein
MRPSFFLAVTLPFAVLLAAPGAGAQPVDAATKSAARSVAEDALKLYDKGDFAGAFEKANRANELVHAPTMALLTGRCLEKLGRWVEASEKYLEAANASLEPNASAAQKSAQTEATKARAALLPRIPAVELALDAPTADAQVTLDGKVVPPAMVGIKRPIDPGKHNVAVARAGASATQDFTLKEADSVRLVLKAPPGNPGNAGRPANPGGSYYTPPPAGGPPPMMYAPGSAPPPAMKRRSTGLFVTGVIFIPVGSIVTLAGTFLLVANAEGGGNVGAPATLGVGLAMLGGGIVMTVVGGKKVPVTQASLLDPRHSPPSPKASITPLLGPMSGLRVQF